MNHTLKSRLIQFSDIPFLFSFSLYFIWQLFQTSTFFLPLPTGFEKVLFLLLCLSLFFRVPVFLKTPGSVLAAAILLTLNFLLVYRAVHYHFLLFYSVMIIGFISIDHRKIMKLYTVILACFLILTFSAACCGAIQSFVYLKAGYIRTALGICYPTDMASYVLFLLMYSWAAWQRIPNLVALILGILCCFFSRYIAMSITSTICSALFSAVVLGHFLYYDCGLQVRIPAIFKSIVRQLMILAFPLFSILIFALIIAYAKSFGPALKLNSILSDRLKLPLEAFHTYGLKAFGSPLPQNGNGFTNFVANEYNFVDSTYPLILLRYGWVLFLALCTTWVATTRKAFKKHDTRLACLLALIAFHSFSEHHFPEINYNPLIVMPFALFTSFSSSQEAFEAGDCHRSTGHSTNVIHILIRLTSLSFLAMLIFPLFFTRMRTVIQILNWNIGGVNGYKVLLTFSIIYGLVVIMIVELFQCVRIVALKTVSTDFKKVTPSFVLAGGSMILLVSAYCLGNHLLSCSMVQYGETLQEDFERIQYIADSVSGKLYVDCVPDLYKKRVSGISNSLFQGDELARFYNTSVITDQSFDSDCFINSGFLFMPVSSTHALYTNDLSLITTIQNDGMNLTGYYNVEKTVDLQSLADLNQLPFDSDRGLVLLGKDHPLKFGPYLSLYSGPYTVEYELSFPKETLSEIYGEPHDQQIATLRASAYWGQKILKEHTVTEEQFEQDGHANIKLPFTSGSYSGIEFLAFPENNQKFSISSIRYYRSPEYDIHMLYNKKRQKFREEFYTLEGVPVETSNGYNACEYDYDYNGRVTEIRYYSSDNRPALTKNGYASLKRKLDNQGRIVSESYFDTDGEPTLCSDGYAIVTREYDQNNNVIVQKYYDKNGNPTATTSIYAEVHRVFNDKHQIIQESYFDTKGQPLTMPSGYVMIQTQYDTSGRAIVKKYLDASGNPVITSNHYAEVHREYTAQNYISKETYYDTNGNIMTLPAGYSMIKRSFDSKGNAVYTEYCDFSGNPVMTTMHYAALQCKYNERNQIIYEAYFGIDQTPIIMPGGYSAVGIKRNDVGDPIELKYYDMNGSLSMHSDGYAIVQREYNEKHLPIIEKYYDSNGNPVITSMEYAEIHKEYNDLRQISRESYFDTNGKPMTLSLGQASVFYERNSSGLPLTICYSGIDGNPVITTKGYAEVHRQYNTRQQIISECFFDANKKPGTNSIGAHKIEYEYDNEGRIERMRYYDNSLQPTLLSWGVFEEQWIYDSDGNISSRRFFDLSGTEVFPPAR